MAQIQQQSSLGGAEDPAARRADDERRAGVVAEREEMCRLLRVDLAPLYQAGDRGGADRVAAGQAQQKRSRSFAGDAEQFRDRRPHQPGKQLWKSQRGQQRRENQKRQKRWNDDPGADRKPPPRALRSRRGRVDQRREGREYQRE